MFSSTKIMQALSPAGAAAGYQIARSLRFNSADSAYLNRTPASAGNRKTWTWSGWVKRSNLGGASPSLFGCYVGAGNPRDALQFATDIIEYAANTSGSSFDVSLKTTQVFRDASAWYHIVFAADTTQATASNRIKIYVNGVQITAFSTATYPSQNADLPTNQAQAHYLGASFAANYLDGYVTDVRFIDGQALDPTSFGETDATTGVWVPKAYTGTYGTNGFWLKFDDNSGTTSTTLGKDSSGNSNNWTPNNFSVTAGVGNDSLVDSPTNYGTDTGVGGEVRGNYATLNFIDAETSSSLSNGNLDQSGGNNVRATMGGIGSGKFYWEFTKTSNRDTSGNTVGHVGLMPGQPTAVSALTTYIFYRDDGTIYENNVLISSGLPTWTNGDVIGSVINYDTSQISFYKNNVFVATRSFPSGITAANAFPAIRNNTGQSGSCNFGQRPFAYTAPSGFKALCTQNLPTPTVGASSTTLADDYFNIALYTGTGANLSVTGLGFQPDFVWIKGRSGATDHGLYDAVRGVQKQLESNTTTAETTETTGLTAFGTDGFTVGTLAQLNTNTATYVGWAWKANGAGSSNTSGSITSTVSANTTAGISVVAWTDPTSGTSYTIGHGLGATPAMIIFKYRAQVSNWLVYHKSIASGSYCYLNTTAAATAISGAVSALSSTTITLGTYYVDNPAQNLIAYCFAEVEGFSKFGSYTGNGSADGPFVYCGFRPRYVMIKRTDSTGDWWILDTSRNAYNITGKYLYANTSGAEGDDSATPGDLDILSNGFKLRIATYQPNASGATFIFAAFAEAPFNYSRAR